jgi:hypothetical protein
MKVMKMTAQARTALMYTSSQTLSSTDMPRMGSVIARTLLLARTSVNRKAISSD